jgi:nudix-type nucleoside diphosphatase (YffH/AdpP family)
MSKVVVRSRKRLLDDFFKVDEAHVEYERFDGTMSPPVRQLVFERGDAVAAVVVERESGALLLTEQFRFPTWDKGPGWLLELMAGMVDGDEKPDDALAREIEEELGYRPEHVEPIAHFYVSPGGSSERIFLFYAEVSAGSRVSAGGGLAAEHENIRVVRLARDDARRDLAAGAIVDAKTIIGLQWFFASR